MHAEELNIYFPNGTVQKFTRKCKQMKQFLSSTVRTEQNRNCGNKTGTLCALWRLSFDTWLIMTLMLMMM
jgi:hypothetical protein